MVDPADDLIGQVLAGRYRIVARLGEGAMGAVYIGEHLRMGRRDAIKVLRKDMARDPEAIARFTRGARNVSAVRHPNVCTIYDFSDTDDGLQFLAMEFIEGETLLDVLEREGRLEMSRAIDIACQTAAALQAAHDVGIVHRDLKPGNIMITRRPDGSDGVKVVDFDIAKGPTEVEGEEVTRLGFVVGTPEYMSPEQLTGDRLDGRSDVYSLGIVLFRMLTGVLPFRATSTQEVMIQRLTADPLRLDEVLPDSPFPAALDAELRRSMARDSADRHASAAAFSAAIDAAAASSAGPAGDSRVATGSGALSGAGAGTGRAAPAADEVPATQITPVPSRPVARGTPGTGTAATGTPSTGAPAGPRRALMAAGVALVAVIAIGATLWLLPDRNGDAAGADAGADLDAVTQLPGSREGDIMPIVSDDVEALSDPTGDTGDTGAGDVAGGGDRSGGTGSDAAVLRLAGQVAKVLDRQFDALNSSPGAASLRAIRDTAGIAWDVATLRRDSATAALVMAQAALMAGDEAECGRWARRGAALDPSPSFDTLIQACR